MLIRKEKNGPGSSIHIGSNWIQSNPMSMCSCNEGCVISLDVSGYKVAKEVCLPYLAAGLGMVGAGLVLDK